MSCDPAKRREEGRNCCINKLKIKKIHRDTLTRMQLRHMSYMASSSVRHGCGNQIAAPMLPNTWQVVSGVVKVVSS